MKLHEGHWNVSYFVHLVHRGHGVATRVFRLVYTQAFDDLGPDMVLTRVRVGNVANLRVLAKVRSRPAREETDNDGHVKVLHELAGSTHRT